MTLRRLTTRLALASLVALLTLAAAVPAGAKPPKVTPPAKVALGHPAVGTSANGLASILVPVRYPIELSGRLAELRVALVGPRGGTIRSWVLHERLNGGEVQLPDRRRRFTFVHRVGLNGTLGRQLRGGASVRVRASGRLDADEDGKPELRSSDSLQGKPSASPRSKPVCSSVPHLRIRRGGRISVPLPVCDRAVDWTAARWASRGNVLVRGERFIYNARKGFRGTDQIRLESKGLTRLARVTVGAPGGLVVRALGDSVTAGFGYYGSGTPMAFEDLLECRPAEKNFNDACSSNSLSTKSEEGPVEYTPDYGLAKNISWAAQWANEYGVTNYRNFAVSGSEPGNWAPGGVFYEKTQQIEREEPDYVLLTLGANPLLSVLLTEPKDLWCAAISELPEFEQCIRDEFTRVGLRANLKKVYAELLARTRAAIFVMGYHLSVPWSALFDSSVEIATANNLLNQEILSVASEFANSRLQVVTPPHFNVGIDIQPAYPSRFSCSIFGFKVDGPSVQSSGTQLELHDHPLSFCSGPTGGGETWVINGDTGIHPSAAGYTQMASQLPAPTGG
jgi:lysophospholipase L1-like esterase